MIPYAVSHPHDATQNQRYPVLYLLHGTGGNEVHRPNFCPNLLPTMNAIMFPRGPGSAIYVPTVRDGLGKAIATDLVSLVDQKGPTISDVRGRAIMDFSMSGFGSRCNPRAHLVPNPQSTGCYPQIVPYQGITVPKYSSLVTDAVGELPGFTGQINDLRQGLAVPHGWLGPC